jgi:hypothetical protein
VEAFATLLRRPGLYLLGYPHPVVRAVAMDKRNEPRIFMLRPRAAPVIDHGDNGAWWSCWIEQCGHTDKVVK